MKTSQAGIHARNGRRCRCGWRSFRSGGRRKRAAARQFRAQGAAGHARRSGDCRRQGGRFGRCEERRRGARLRSRQHDRVDRRRRCGARAGSRAVAAKPGATLALADLRLHSPIPKPAAQHLRGRLELSRTFQRERDGAEAGAAELSRTSRLLLEGLAFDERAVRPHSLRSRRVDADRLGGRACRRHRQAAARTSRKPRRWTMSSAIPS